MAEVALSLTGNPQVVAYFAVLGWAVYRCATRLIWGRSSRSSGGDKKESENQNQNHNKSQDKNENCAAMAAAVDAGHLKATSR